MRFLDSPFWQTEIDPKKDVMSSNPCQLKRRNKNISSSYYDIFHSNDLQSRFDTCWLKCCFHPFMGCHDLKILKIKLPESFSELKYSNWSMSKAIIIVTHKYRLNNENASLTDALLVTGKWLISFVMWGGWERYLCKTRCVKWSLKCPSIDTVSWALQRMALFV